MSEFGNQMVSVAASQVGYVEGPNNSNKYGAYFGHDNEPWCCWFILWCQAQLGVDGQSYGFNAGVTSFYDKNNITVDQLEPGDYVCYGTNRAYWISPRQHAEIFTGFDSNGNLLTIGGNTGGGSQSEGDGVYRKTRGRDEVTACIHFEPGSPGPIPPPTPPPEPGEDGIMLKPYEYYRTLRRW